MTRRTRKPKGPRIPPSQPRYCNVIGCTARVILARPVGGARYAPFEANDSDPSIPGCRVIVAGVAWRPQDYVQDLIARNQLSESKARELAEGYPFHLPHRHTPDERHHP